MEKKINNIEAEPLASPFFMRPSSGECGHVVWPWKIFQPVQAAVMTLSGTLSGLLQDPTLRGVLLALAP